MDQILEDRFLHILHTNNWLRESELKTGTASPPQPTPVLVGGESSRKTRKIVAAVSLMVAGVAILAYAMTCREKSEDKP